MAEEKISVIVPVYNVEPYLRECLDSIVNQTYHNLEIILVDDGSPDNCGKICDEYADKDGRIAVIHKENGGVSSARNAGLERATGAWIGWVDPDDWVEPDMFAFLIEGAEKTDADIIICTFAVESRQGTSIVGYSEEHFFDTRKAIEELLKDRQMTNHAWNKLYRRRLYDGVRYPAGRVYEDLATTYRLFEKAGYVFARAGIKYHYRANSGGITHSNNLKNQLDNWRSAFERYNEMGARYPEFEELLMVSPVGAAMETWSRIWPARKKLDARTKELLDEMAGFARLHWRKALRLGAFGLTGRLRILLTLYKSGWSFWLAWQLRKLYEIKHG